MGGKIAHRTRKPEIGLMDFHGNLIVKNLTMFCGSKRQKSSGKGVARHAKFILKTKNIFSKNPGVTNKAVFGVAGAHTLFTNKVCVC